MTNNNVAEEDKAQMPKRFQKATDMPELLKSIMKPDMAEKNEFLTKELKISNIKRVDLEMIVEMTDLALQWMEKGAKDFAFFLITLRDVYLSSTSSIDGFERMAEITEIRRQELKEEEQRGLFGKMFNRGGT